MTGLYLALIVLIAAFLQSLAGFGFAVVIMPLFTLALGLRTAAPTVALVALTVYVINALRFRRSLNVGAVLRLGGAAALGVPVGVWLLSQVDEALVTGGLGLVLVAFALYSLLRPAARWRPSPWWIYPAGFLAGCLGGAYNTPGPPAIVYGSLRRWPRDEFRAAMQTLFLISGTLVVASHLAIGHLTAQVWHYYFYALPALALGILAASRVDRRIEQKWFRVLVAVMILALGVSLAVEGFGK